MMLRRSLWDPSAFDEQATEPKAEPRLTAGSCCPTTARSNSTPVLRPIQQTIGPPLRSTSISSTTRSSSAIRRQLRRRRSIHDRLRRRKTMREARRKPRGRRASTGGSRPISMTIRAGFRASSRSRRPMRPPARPEMASRRRLRRNKAMRRFETQAPGPAGLDWRITPDFDDDPGWVPGVITQPPADYDLPHDRRRHRAAGYVVARPLRKSQRFRMCGPPSTGRLRPDDPDWVPGVVFPPSTTDDDDLRPDTDAVEDSDPPSRRRHGRATSGSPRRGAGNRLKTKSHAQYPGIVWPVNWWLL